MELTCECHKINWRSIINDGEYSMRNGLPLKGGVSCEDKVETGDMAEEGYENICRYIPGEGGSNFPEEVVQYFLDKTDQPNKVDPSPKKPDTLAWWQEPGDTPVSWEQQTLDPILLALNSKCTLKV